MFTYKNTQFKIFALGLKFCWAGSDTPMLVLLGAFTQPILPGEGFESPTKTPSPSLKRTEGQLSNQS